VCLTPHRYKLTEPQRVDATLLGEHALKHSVPARWTPQEWTPVRSCGKHGQLPKTSERENKSCAPSGVCLTPHRYKLTEPQRVDATLLGEHALKHSVPARWTPQEWTPVRSCGKHGQLPKTSERENKSCAPSGVCLTPHRYKLTEPQRVDAKLNFGDCLSRTFVRVM
jgi:hypothetical protein